jgi:hypothetical protein
VPSEIVYTGVFCFVAWWIEQALVGLVAEPFMIADIGGIGVGVGPKIAESD